MERTKGTWRKDDVGADSWENMVQCLRDSAGTESEWVAVGTADEEGYAVSVAYCHPANADFICKSVNYHDRLVEVAQSLRKVKRLADNKSSLVSQQGQALSGYAELAEYRATIEKLNDLLKELEG